MPTTLDSLLKITDNKFLLANAVATRAKEISEGSIPYIDEFNPLNPIDTAMKEFSAGKLKIKILEGPAAKPMKVIEQKAKNFWTIDNLEKKEHKKVKKTKKK